MRDVLTVVPMGGLCNRIRVVLSAYHLAPTFPLPVCVEWGRDGDCYARFDELFQPLCGENFSIANRAWLNLYDTRRNLHLPGMLRRFVYDRQHPQFNPLREGDLTDFVGGRKRVYVSGGYALCDYPTMLINLLRPIPLLQQRIDRITAQFSPATIGVHIRRTDHRQAILSSPDEAFERRMREEIQKNPTTNFFLATDDAQVKERFCRTFGERILTQHTDYRRSTTEGIFGAVIDLYALAKTQKIFGSFYSSFSGSAAEFRNIPIETIDALKT